MNIQIFGFNGCSNTRKAQRFFKERNIRFHFVDMDRKPVSPGELRSIAASVPADELIDRDGKAYVEGGYSYREFDIIEEVLENQRLLKTPLVRNGSKAAVGYDPSVWTEWLREAK